MILKTKTSADVAILMGYDSRWSINTTHLKPELNVKKAVNSWHASLMRNHIVTDGLDPRDDLSKYKLVIAPRLYLVDSSTHKNLENFVKNGGTLVLTYRSGVVDQYNKMFTSSFPGPLAEMAGIKVDGYGAMENSNSIEFANAESDDLVVNLWTEEIKITTAKSLAVYKEGWLKGIPAITINDYGKGKVIYIGTSVEDQSKDMFLKWIVSEVNVAKPSKIYMNQNIKTQM